MNKKPHLTELLSLLDKPALKKWANQQGLKGIDITKESSKWMNAGTSIHSQIENYIRKGEPFISDIDQSYFKCFIEDKEILGLENNIETEWFKGRYDIKVKWKDKIYLMDFKNHSKRIYFENKLQLIGYGMAEQCDCFAVVSVPSFTVMNFKVENRSPYEEILKCLSKIYTLKQEIENPDIDIEVGCLRD
jgi:hypothetical protein